MILHVFIVVFFNGFVLMLGILSVMRGLYALGVCQRPQTSTDHERHISLDPFRSNTPNRESNDGKYRYDRAAGLIKQNCAATRDLRGGRERMRTRVGAEFTDGVEQTVLRHVLWHLIVRSRI
jgi:hypothetical protein